MELFSWCIAALPGGNGVLLDMDFIYQAAASYGHEDGGGSLVNGQFSHGDCVVDRIYALTGHGLASMTVVFRFRGAAMAIPAFFLHYPGC